MAKANTFALPVELEGVTRDWLETALAHYAPGVRVRDFKVADAIRTTCTKLRLKLDLENNPPERPIPESVILKGGFEPHSRKMWGMHKSEALAYATLAPALGLRTPTPYFAGWDEKNLQGIIIMEDLVARGVEFCSPLKPQTFEQVARRIRAIARFHAQTWDSPDIRPGGRFDWLGEMTPIWHPHFDQYLVPDVWNHYVTSARGAAASTEFHDRDWMYDALDRMAALARTLPSCALHGDTHLGNLYIDVDGEPGFFDCISITAPGMIEVAYHIGCALDLSTRRHYEGALIQIYLDTLRASGVTPPRFEEALHQYQVFLAYGYMVFIINEAIFQSEANNTAYTARFSQAMLDHDTKAKLAAIRL
jgi:hypothetical protein